MKIKSGVWCWLSAACGGIGLLYGMGLEGTAQVGGVIADGEFITAMVLILLAVLFMKMGFAAYDREQREKRRVHRAQKGTATTGKRKAG